MVALNTELDQAVVALTAEILKLVPVDSGVRETLSVTLENAFSRLATAILTEANPPNESCVPYPTPDAAEALVAGLN